MFQPSLDYWSDPFFKNIFRSVPNQKALLQTLEILKFKNIVKSTIFEKIALQFGTNIQSGIWTLQQALYPF